MALTASEARRLRQQALAKAMQRADEPTIRRTINGVTMEMPLERAQTLQDIRQSNLTPEQKAQEANIERALKAQEEEQQREWQALESRFGAESAGSKQALLEEKQRGLPVWDTPGQHLALNKTNAEYVYKRKSTPTQADYDKEVASFGKRSFDPAHTFKYNGVDAVFVPREYVNRGYFSPTGKQWLTYGYLNEDVRKYLKPATIDPALITDPARAKIAKETWAAPYDGYLIEKSIYDKYNLGSATGQQPLEFSVKGEGKTSPAITGIAEENGKLYYVGMRGGAKAGEVTKVGADGVRSSGGWKQGGGTLRKIAGAISDLPVLGKIALAIAVPGAAQAMAAFNAGQALGRGDLKGAVLSSLPLVLPSGAQGAPAVPIPGMENAVGFVSDQLGVSANTAGAIIKDAINFAASGGDIKQFLQSQAAAFVGQQAGGFAEGFAKQFDVAGLEKIARQVTAAGTKALLLNQDAGEAAKNAFADAAVPMALSSVPGYAEWAKANPKMAEALRATTVSAAKTGDPAAALQSGAESVFVQTVIPEAKKAIGVTSGDLTEYQQRLLESTIATAIRGKPLDSVLQNFAIAEAKRVVDASIAKDEGWQTAEQRALAQKQYGKSITPEEYATKQSQVTAEAGAANALPPQPAQPTETAAPSAADIVLALQAQDAKANTLEQILADAGITVPEQQGLLAGDYKQEGAADLLARGAESALGALIPSAQASGQDRLVLPQPSEMEGAQPRDYKYFFDMMAQPDPQAAYAGLSAEEKAAVDRAGKEFQASSQERQLDLLSSYRAGDFAPTETPTESYIDQGLLVGREPTLEEVVSPPITMEDYIDRGGLGGVPSTPSAPTFVPELPSITEPTPQTLESLLEQLQPPSVGPTPTETAIDSGSLGGYTTTPTEAAINLGGLGGYGTTSTEDFIDLGGLGGYGPTPTESVIDLGGLTGGYPTTPTESVIDTGGLTGGYPTTPTEDFIDTGGLTGGYPTTPTEDYIDAGGLGGGTIPILGGGGTGGGGAGGGTGGGRPTTPGGTPTTRPGGAGGIDLLQLLGLAGMMQRKDEAPPPIPVVGEIKPYDFSTDLLAGIYPQKTMDMFGANDQLLKLARR